MSQCDIADDESIGTTQTDRDRDRMTTAAVFGIDAQGRKHRYDGRGTQVVVTDDGEIVHAEPLARPRVPEWIDFVGEDLDGWDDEWWDETSGATAMTRHANAASDDEYQTLGDILGLDGGGR